MHNHDEFLTYKQLAEILKVSVGGLRNRHSRGEPMPPSIKPPGSRRRLFSRGDVDKWIRDSEQASDE